MRKIYTLIAFCLLTGHYLLGQTNFSYTGSIQSYTVPAGIFKIQIETWGAQGGSGYATIGGLGGYSKGDLIVAPGQTYYVYVGGSGSGTTGGWNGGGAGGIDLSGQNGSGGGGASDVRFGGTSLADRIIIGGGGAGGGRDGVTGDGGGTSGTASANYASGYGGQPGTQDAGGLAYITTRGATNGTLGQGGAGSTGYDAAGGGGGGGGYYGGGGGTSTFDHGNGWSAGGGGGSGYIGGVTNASTTTGVRTGNGNVIITVLVVPPTVTTSVVSSITSTTASSGGDVTSENGYACTAKGVCWSTSNPPTIADSKTNDGSGLGAFTSSITGLTAGTTYYVRSYATSSVGTGYGSIETFTTPKNEQTITFTDDLSTKTYGDAAFNLMGTASSGLTVSYASSNTSVATVSGSTVTIVGQGTSVITASQGGNANYNSAPDAQQTLTVNKKSVTITGVTAATKVYDGTTTATLSGGTVSTGVGSETLTIIAGTGSFTDKNVGTKAVTAIGYALANGANGGLVSNYSLSAQPILPNQAITAKELTVSNAVVTTKVYDGNADAAITGATLAGVVGADAVTLANAATGQFNNANVGNAKPVSHNMSLSGAGSGNYSLTSPVLTGNITAKQLTVSNALVTNKVYNGNADAAITGATLSGVVGADDVTLADATAGTFNNANVGTNKPVATVMTIAGAGTGNYTLTQPVLEGNITAKELTVADAVVTTKVYDGNANTAITGATLTGVVGADDVTLGDTGAGTFNNANVGTEKPVATAMTIEGAATGNYTLTQPVITGDITAKELTVAESAVTTKVYDGNTDAVITSATLTGVVGADDVTLDDAGAGTFNNANVGTEKPVTTAMAITGAATGNYTLTQPVITGNITAKELTVADVAVTSKVYDGNTDAEITGATLAGIVGADDVVLGDATAGTFDNSNVGTDKPVTTAMAITGASTDNYTLTQPVLSGEITAKELTISDAAVATKVYDGTTDAAINGAILTGVVGADDVTLGDASAGTFNNANVGTNKPVATVMTIAGAGTGNYTLTQPVLEGNITAKELTVADAVVTTKVYDGNTDAAITGAALVGVVGIDDVTLADANAGMFNDVDAGADKQITHAMDITGAGSGNYTFAPPVLTGEITAKELTVTDATVTSKVYDGTVAAVITGATLTGVVGADDVALADADAGTFNDANVGTEKPVATAMTISGAGTVNYTLTQPVISGDINAKELLITGTFEVEDKNYDGTTDATISVNNLVLNGLVTNDEVELTAVAAFDSQVVGENISVRLTNATAISGASAFNYALSLTDAPTITANIIDPTINVDRLSGSGFTMYPNPVSNMLTVETGSSEILRIRLLSITGQEVFAGDITNKMQIDTSSLHPGIYFIAIIDGDQQTIYKLIKK